MNNIAISAENLSKEYRIGRVKLRYKTFRDTFTEALQSPFRRMIKLLRGETYGAADLDRSFWALQDISFDVGHGEVVGIIGRNGAGKSTLLKILSRITEPTRGQATIYGRVGSLLEVGTGFHQELTGRENVFLNGAILGMSRKDIEQNFDEIVAFAEMEQFIDTPVKHYSSGMQVRLAFAVAAHLEPEILIVDEVLAVGDAEFQKKCMGKMDSVAGEGRTVLFVSHNMQAVTRLCDRTILLDAGRIVQDGPSHEVISKYLHSDLGTSAAREWPDPQTAPGNKIVRLRAMRVRNQDGGISEAIDIRQPVQIEMEYEVLKPGYALMPFFSLRNGDGIIAFISFDQNPEWRGHPRPTGHYVSTGWIPGNFLSEGTMVISAGMRSIVPEILHFSEEDAVAFQVIDVLNADTARGDYAKTIRGVVRPLLRWETRTIGANHTIVMPLETETVNLQGKRLGR